MRALQYIIAGICLLSLVACKKEIAPSPSPASADPFVRKDNPANVVTHTIYELYNKTGVPVFYNDTVQSSPLVLLNIQYGINSSNSTLVFRYLQSQDDILFGIDFVGTELLPRLGEKLKPYSLLIVDSILLNYYYDSVYNYEYFNTATNYPGLRTLVVGNVRQLGHMTPEALTAYKNDIFKTILIKQLALLNGMDAFYAPAAVYYGRPVTGYEDNGYLLPFQQKELYGFLSQGTEGDTYYRNPNKADDLDQYLDKMLSMSEADFRMQYGDYNLVSQKYTILRSLVTALGFNL